MQANMSCSKETAMPRVLHKCPRPFRCRTFKATPSTLIHQRRSAVYATQVCCIRNGVGAVPDTTDQAHVAKSLKLWWGPVLWSLRQLAVNAGSMHGSRQETRLQAVSLRYLDLQLPRAPASIPASQSAKLPARVQIFQQLTVLYLANKK